MTNVIQSLNKPMNQVEKILDPQLWHACAGGMAQIPPINSRVYYFPQGHAEYANKTVDFGGFSRIPPLIPCRVSAIKYLADTETDEVYAKIKLLPLRGNECDVADEGKLLGFEKDEEKEKSNSFAKTLTQSDANNGGGFSVPRYCAETIFPRLDYSAEPPVQTILVKDVHGEIWKFRHIYRGTPRRHLLTTGWSNFVNQKKLVAGDSIVFLRAENGDLCVGIRRAKKGIGGGVDVVSSGWNTGAANCADSLYRGFSGFLSENGNFGAGNAKKGGENGEMGLKEKGTLRAESVVEAANLAVNGRPFEVVYFPRASTPEFVVRASAVNAAMRLQWCSGMRFKMAFETEDSSRISWFMGTISSVHVEDPVRWPNSPWRLLQVVWDEPELLQNVKRVNPWLVELVSNIPAINLSRFSPPRKRPRFPQHSEFPFVHLPMPPLLGNPLSPSSPLGFLHEHISAGIQGARHTDFGLSSSDLHFKKLQMGLQSMDFNHLDYASPLPKIPTGNCPSGQTKFDALQCTLKTGSSTQDFDKNNEAKKPVFVLFGQPILTEQQLSQNDSSDRNQENMANNSNGSGSAVIQNFPPEASSDGEFPLWKDQKLEIGFGVTGHCQVFVESEDVGRTLDLSLLGSYEELYKKLTFMFNMEQSEMLSNVVYSDVTGMTKHMGDEPFSDFTKKARRLTILMDSSSDNL
ncbi:auxin response factor 18-like [Primulina huaijiensis]|uniref:auxin response factor 18-like n=1 Tax=Primulina huaijiensis TaxID=1492673 RepID=UPI003CC72913